jgi:hypothetical protein
VQWTVVTQIGDVVHGHEESGRVSVATKEDGLDIYLVSEDSNIYCPPLELTEELAACCGITNPEHVQLLTHILVQQDVQRISSDLERKGIPNDLEGFDNTNAKLPEPLSADVKISSSFDDHLDTLSSQGKKKKTGRPFFIQRLTDDDFDSSNTNKQLHRTSPLSGLICCEDC